MSFGSNTPAWHNLGSPVPSLLPFSFSKGENESEQVPACLPPWAIWALGAIHSPGRGWWVKLALILISSCVSGNGLAAGRQLTVAVPPERLPGRYLLGFQQMPTEAPGVFFYACVLPETKCFESAFSLKKVERGREMELPLLKQMGTSKCNLLS